MVKWVEDDRKHLHFILLVHPANQISGNELDDVREEEEEVKEGKEEKAGMSEDDSELWTMLIINNAPCSNSPRLTGGLKAQDLEIQHVEELDQVDADFNNIALMELERANNPDAQAQMEDQGDSADVNWWVTVIVTVEQLSEFSHC